MNVDTGRIADISELTEAEQASPEWMPIDAGKMTKKQRANKMVSIHDNRSHLGKQRVAAKKRARKLKQKAQRKGRK